MKSLAKNKQIISFLAVLIELILVIIDTNSELAVHRIVRYVETGVLSQDLTEKLSMLWLRMLNVSGLYVYIDKVIIGALCVSVLLGGLGLFLKKKLLTVISVAIDGIYVFVPFIFSFIIKETGLHTRILYKMSLFGYLMIILVIVAAVLQFDNIKFKPIKLKTRSDYTEEIKKLSELYQAGAITQEEFEKKKKELLG